MKKVLFILLAILLTQNLISQNLDSLPLFQISDLNYEGAFRIPADNFGVSNINYSEGPIAYNKLNHSLFIVGHSHDQAIAEFEIPALVISDSVIHLNMTNTPIQDFAYCLNNTSDGNPQNINRIGGMYFSEEGKLIVNGYEYYDAAADNTLTTIIIDDANDLSNSIVNGYFRFIGGAGHTSGWISEIPLEWQVELNADMITGQSSGIPIISRTSVGPSAFTFNKNDLLGSLDTINTTSLLDFSLNNPLNNDLSNTSLTNDIWTHLSRSTYGFIVPGTRTYFTLGYSGGHTSGVCYKCTQNDGNLCGGYCAPDTSDYYQRYWLWDMNDLIDVKNGIIESYDVLPYSYGTFNTPHQVLNKNIGGASYDIESGKLYLSIQKADQDQGYYSRPPIIEVYNTNNISAVDAYLDFNDISIFPNPTEDIFEIRGLLQNYIIEVLDSSGNLYESYSTTENTLKISLSSLPQGLYFIKINSNSNNALKIDKIIKQ